MIGSPRVLRAAVLVLACSAAALAAETKPSPPQPGDLAEARKLVDQTFGDQIAGAKTADAQAGVARKLLDAAQDASIDAKTRYALLSEARTLAEQAGDLDLGMQSIDAIGQAYQIDTPSMKAEAIARWASGKRTPEQARAGLEQLQQQVKELIQADRYEPLENLLRAGRKLAVETKQADARLKVGELGRDVAQAQAMFKAADAGVKKLSESPDDPAAHLAVGTYLLFIKGDAKPALPHLAAGSDPKIAEVAKKELADPKETAEQLAVADGWWELADAQPPALAPRARAHAAEWYRAAQPGLTGLSKFRVEKLLAGLEQPAAKPSAEHPATVPKENKPAEAQQWRWTVVWHNTITQDMVVTLNPDGTGKAEERELKWEQDPSGITVRWGGARRSTHLAFQRDGSLRSTDGPGRIVIARRIR